ncbi:hypothetical protein KAU11_07680 [Candidatus Babeliales bacterium]|nr:hypothetical protein [Candidatus Babeliales bacterium]
MEEHHLIIIKNCRITHETNEYLIINTEDNLMYKKEMTPTKAYEFVEHLEAVAVAPIHLVGKDYKLVDYKDFLYPLPF